jgi:hypothetical protein
MIGHRQMRSVPNYRADMCKIAINSGEVEVGDTVCGLEYCDRVKVHQIAAKRAKKIIPPEAYLRGCPHPISALKRPADLAAISGRKAEVSISGTSNPNLS